MVQALPGVRFLEDCSVSGLTVTGDKHTVTGVQVRGPGGGGPAQVTGDLVVDATGRGSRTPVWLAELGYQSPGRSGSRSAWGMRRGPTGCGPARWTAIS